MYSLGRILDCLSAELKKILRRFVEVSKSQEGRIIKKSLAERKSVLWLRTIAQEAAFQISIEQSVKEMFPGFAPNREPPGCICARGEAALDGFADRYILSLNALATVMLARLRCLDVFEVSAK